MKIERSYGVSLSVFFEICIFFQKILRFIVEISVGRVYNALGKFLDNLGDSSKTILIIKELTK